MFRRKDRYVRGEQELFRLSYRLIHHCSAEKCDPADYYGIVIEQYVVRSCRMNGYSFLGTRQVDRSEIPGLSEHAEEAECFLEMAAEGAVMPVSLFEIYDDWMSAFHPCRDNEMTDPADAGSFSDNER